MDSFSLEWGLVLCSQACGVWEMACVPYQMPPGLEKAETFCLPVACASSVASHTPTITSTLPSVRSARRVTQRARRALNGHRARICKESAASHV